MSRLTDIADAVWVYSSRSVDSNSPNASDGTILDDIGYSVWTYTTRELDTSGGTTAPTAVFSGPFGGPMIGCF